MKRKRRTYYTEEQKTEMWERGIYKKMLLDRENFICKFFKITPEYRQTDHQNRGDFKY